MIDEIESVAVVGAGLVGISWATVFARSGLTVRIFDADPVCRERAKSQIARSLTEMQPYGLVDDVAQAIDGILVARSLEEAVGAADYVQESVFEDIETKRSVSRQIDAALRNDALVGSSTSGIPGSLLFEDLPRREQFFVVHPANPPHLIPLVEIVPSPWSRRDAIAPLRQLMEAVGQRPIVVSREIEGFVLNRLQGALLNEAWALFSEGYASAADIDRTISDGLGLRWVLMGPFETIDLNAPGGIEDYANRLGPLYYSIAASRKVPMPWSAEAIERMTIARRTALALSDLPDRQRWRDAKLLALKAHLDNGQNKPGR